VSLRLDSPPQSNQQVRQLKPLADDGSCLRGEARNRRKDLILWMRSSIAPTFDQIPRRFGKQGVRLRLAFRVSQIDGSSCTPLSGAIIDVWHCDALGVYSDVTDRVSVPSGKSSCAACDTNANGLEFVTIIRLVSRQNGSHPL